MADAAAEVAERYARYLQAFNDGDLDAIDETCTEDYVLHEPPYPDTVGVRAHRDSVAALRLAFPDLRFSIDGQTVRGDRVISRWTLTGTCAGGSPVVPGPPAGRLVRITGCSVDRVVDGAVAETWNYVDYLGLLRQLGVVPTTGEADLTASLSHLWPPFEPGT